MPDVSTSSFRGLFSIDLKGQAYYGYVDSSGKVVIPAEYSEATHFFGEVAFVKGQTEQYAAIDRSGQTQFRFPKGIIPLFLRDNMIASAMWAKPSSPHYGFQEYGACNLKGDVVIPHIYASVVGFDNGLAFVYPWDQDTGFYIRKDGSRAYVPQFAEGSPFAEGVAAVRADRQSDSAYHYIDRDGTVAWPDTYEDASEFHEGLAKVEVNGLDGYIDLKGRMVIEPQFQLAEDFSCGRALIYDAGLHGYIDKTGTRIVAPMYILASPYSDGLAFARTEEQAGFIDTQGHFVIANHSIENVSEYGFQDGWWAVRLQNQKVVYINREGEMLHPPVRGVFVTYLLGED
jgi:hypothetical protein